MAPSVVHFVVLVKHLKYKIQSSHCQRNLSRMPPSHPPANTHCIYVATRARADVLGKCCCAMACSSWPPAGDAQQRLWAMGHCGRAGGLHVLRRAGAVPGCRNTPAVPAAHVGQRDQVSAGNILLRTPCALLLSHGLSVPIRPREMLSFSGTDKHASIGWCRRWWD